MSDETKTRYIELWKTVKRDGVQDLLNWLDATDFYTAPSSTKYHLSREGGLLEHSLNVYDILAKRGLDPESTIITALGHDYCKINFYTQEMRNVKEDGVWTQKPFYTIKDQFPFGHGEKSVLFVNRFVKLKPSEFMAIRWHMGGFTSGIQDWGLSQSMAEAFKTYPLALFLHLADMEATYVSEVTEEVTP